MQGQILGRKCSNCVLRPLQFLVVFHSACQSFQGLALVGKPHGLATTILPLSWGHGSADHSSFWPGSDVIVHCCSCSWPISTWAEAHTHSVCCVIGCPSRQFKVRGLWLFSWHYRPEWYLVWLHWDEWNLMIEYNMRRFECRHTCWVHSFVIHISLLGRKMLFCFKEGRMRCKHACRNYPWSGRGNKCGCVKYLGKGQQALRNSGRNWSKLQLSLVNKMYISSHWCCSVRF